MYESTGFVFPDSQRIRAASGQLVHALCLIKGGEGTGGKRTELGEAMKTKQEDPFHSKQREDAKCLAGCFMQPVTALLNLEISLRFLLTTFWAECKLVLITCHVQGLFAGGADACSVGSCHPELILSVGLQVFHSAVGLLHLNHGHYGEDDNHR